MAFDDFVKEILGGVRRQMEQQQHVPGPQPLPPPEEEGGYGSVMRAVVQVVALRQGFIGGLSTAWTGSGSIVDPSGIILTNCHVANPRAMGMSAPPADRLGIAITERSDEPPALSYFAEVVAESPELDLAILRIVADVRGRRAGSLSLPTVDIGDSDSLQIGDRLSIFGYPGIGGETVTFTSGNVSGFSRDANVAVHRAWIKTDATIAGGNSGGMAVNEYGQLIGVPTQAAAGSGVTPVDARPVLDTNRDGRVDERDTPMAIGGFINGLRPVRLAFPLLQRAGMQIEVETPGKVRRQHAPSSDSWGTRSRAEQAEFANLLFSTRVTPDGRPIHPTTHIPEGVDTVYATFEFDNLRDGTPWSVTWMSNGERIIEQEDVWDDGDEGRKAVKVSNRKGLPPGEYHLVLGIGGKVALEGKVVVGNPVDETDSEISGRLVDSRSGAPIPSGSVMVLKPDASLRQFLRSQDMRDVLTSAESDREGRFTFPDQLPKGTAYSLIALARGYQPVAVDQALRLSSAAPEQADIGDIELQGLS
ncbi:MAG: trypsin-like peptidase domain-containing protein [Planctomycetales bacterium]|nr:trypsin-like peptidase domain-containing protein [Planctomycetales bacterium]